MNQVAQPQDEPGVRGLQKLPIRGATSPSGLLLRLAAPEAVRVFLNVSVISEQGFATQALGLVVWDSCEHQITSR